MKLCPRCHVYVDERFRRCDDCGYDWANDPPSARESAGIRFGRFLDRNASNVLFATLFLLFIFSCCVLPIWLFIRC